MSQADIEVLVRYQQAWMQRDWDALEALLHPDVTWEPAGDEPETDTRRGPAEVVQAARKWVGTFEDMSAEARGIRDLDSHIVVELVFSGTPPGGANRVTLEETHVFRLEDGKLREIREYRTLEQALESVRGAPE